MDYAYEGFRACDGENAVSNVAVVPANVVLSAEGPINPHTYAVIGLKPRVPPNNKCLVTMLETSRRRRPGLGDSFWGSFRAS